MPHLVVIASAVAATAGVLLLMRDALALASPRRAARPWRGIACGALLVGISALWAPLDTVRIGSAGACDRDGGGGRRGALVLAPLDRARRGVQAALCFVAVRALVAGACSLVPAAGAGRFELPLAEVAVIEGAAVVGAAAPVAGVAVAAAGILAAWGWSHASLGPPLGALPLVVAAARCRSRRPPRLSPKRWRVDWLDDGRKRSSPRLADSARCMSLVHSGEAALQEASASQHEIAASALLSRSAALGRSTRCRGLPASHPAHSRSAR